VKKILKELPHKLHSGKFKPTENMSPNCIVSRKISDVAVMWLSQDHISGATDLSWKLEV